MKKVLKTLGAASLVAVCALGLVSCGLSSDEKNAKAYMKEHASDLGSALDGWNYKGSGLSYSSDTLTFNMSSDKGTYKDDKYTINITVKDGDTSNMTLTAKKGGDDSLYKIQETAVKVAVAALYATVGTYAAAYTNEQSSAK